MLHEIDRALRVPCWKCTESACCASEGGGSSFSHFCLSFFSVTVCLCMVWILHNEFMFFLKINGDIFAVVLLVCVVFEILWRNPILIKICSVFSFLISLVADPSFPLYLIVSCGKFLRFQGLLNFCLHFFSNQQLQ